MGVSVKSAVGCMRVRVRGDEGEMERGKEKEGR